MAGANKEEKKLTPEEEEMKQRISDLKEIVEMRGGAGIRYLRHIMSIAGIYRSAYEGNAKTNFVLGKQALALQILEDLQHAATKQQKAEILL